MNILKVFIKSFRMRTLAVNTYAWFFNFIFSLFMYIAVCSFYSGTGAYSQIWNLQGNFNSITLFREIHANFLGATSIFTGLGIFLFLLYFIFSIFFSGGIFSALINRFTFPVKRILGDSQKNFFAFLLIGLICLLIWIPLFLVSLLGFVFIFKNFSANYNESMLQILWWIWCAVCLISVAYSMAVYDFARIIKIRYAGNAWKCFTGALSLVRRNKFGLLGLYVYYSVFFVLAGLLFSLGIRNIPAVHSPWFLLLFFQVSLWIRYVPKIAFIQAEIEIASWKKNSLETPPESLPEGS